MKVSHILSESGPATAVKLDFNELTSLQIAALRAIADERLDFENASDQMMQILYDLQNYNLLDTDFELTRTGGKAVSLAQELGGSVERRKAAAKARMPTNIDIDPNDVYSDDYGGDSDYGDEYMSVHQPNRFGSPNQNM